jgi:hypothetical protein
VYIDCNHCRLEQSFFDFFSYVLGGLVLVRLLIAWILSLLPMELALWLAILFSFLDMTSLAYGFPWFCILGGYSGWLRWCSLVSVGYVMCFSTSFLFFFFILWFLFFVISIVFVASLEWDLVIYVFDWIFSFVSCLYSYFFMYFLHCTIATSVLC